MPRGREDNLSVFEGKNKESSWHLKRLPPRKSLEENKVYSYSASEGCCNTMLWKKLLEKKEVLNSWRGEEIVKAFAEEG